jgi:hypothetical protein
VAGADLRFETVYHDYLTYRSSSFGASAYAFTLVKFFLQNWGKAKREGLHVYELPNHPQCSYVQSEQYVNLNHKFFAERKEWGILKLRGGGHLRNWVIPGGGTPPSRPSWWLSRCFSYHPAGPGVITSSVIAYHMGCVIILTH